MAVVGLAADAVVGGAGAVSTSYDYTAAAVQPATNYSPSAVDVIQTQQEEPSGALAAYMQAYGDQPATQATEAEIQGVTDDHFAYLEQQAMEPSPQPPTMDELRQAEEFQALEQQFGGVALDE